MRVRALEPPQVSVLSPAQVIGDEDERPVSEAPLESTVPQ